jgi:hypothetical protein
LGTCRLPSPRHDGAPEENPKKIREGEAERQIATPETRAI